MTFEASQHAPQSAAADWSAHAQKYTANDAQPKPPSTALAIRQALAGLHQQIEQLPIAVAMFRGSVTRSAYCDLLRATLPIQQQLESHLDASSLASQGLWVPATMARSAAIQRDLQALGASSDLTGLPNALSALVAPTCAALQQCSPMALLGCLYVGEGSRNGSRILLAPLAQALGVAAQPGQGVDYHLDGMTDGLARWKNFLMAMEHSVTRPEDRAEVQAGAQTMMRALFAVYQAAMP